MGYDTFSRRPSARALSGGRPEASAPCSARALYISGRGLLVLDEGHQPPRHLGTKQLVSVGEPADRADGPGSRVFSVVAHFFPVPENDRPMVRSEIRRPLD
jgi:hypothetical protein